MDREGEGKRKRNRYVYCNGGFNAIATTCRRYKELHFLHVHVVTAIIQERKKRKHNYATDAINLQTVAHTPAAHTTCIISGVYEL